jgi:uncharacterized protein
MDAPFTLATIPLPLHWDVHPVSFRSDGDTHLTIEAGPDTDLFVDPAGDTVRLTAPRLLGDAPEGDFRLSARVEVGFAGDFDAGALLVWAADDRWGKLCFEYSPDREPMVVSVVTRGRSDDANAFVVDGDAVWLRVTRHGRAYAFHASTDGERWRFVRNFELGTGPVRVGFLAQSPTGKGCRVGFADLRYTTESLVTLRDGS